jgi:hypothetical protein
MFPGSIGVWALLFEPATARPVRFSRVRSRAALPAGAPKRRRKHPHIKTVSRTRLDGKGTLGSTALYDVCKDA